MRSHLMLFLLLVAGGCNDDLKVEYDPDLGTDCPVAQPQSGSFCSFLRGCYYLDACTNDRMGVMATCQSGKVVLGYDLPLILCPSSAPKDGDSCPCVEGGRQQLPCNYGCKEGGTLQTTCDATTKKWKQVSSPATCTPEPGDGGI